MNPSIDSKYTLRGYLKTIESFILTLDGYDMNYEKKILIKNAILKVDNNIREYLDIDKVKHTNKKIVINYRNCS